ncbi:MAG TPA: hypothetical protein VNT31_01210 [Nocardioides sp.]|nr:hypothetical protein [Nocardioides sp.]
MATAIALKDQQVGNKRRRRHPATTACADRACAQADWVTTAAHAAPRRERRPWGTVHVKQDGALVTACGVYVAEWPVFWDLSLLAGPDVCVTCVAAVRESQTGFRQ